MTAHTTDRSARRRPRGLSEAFAQTFGRALQALAHGPGGHASTSATPAETRVTPAVWPNDPVKLHRRDTP